jgi:hypothetical protein
MKPLLRAVLIVDAGLYAGSGAVLLLTPLSGLQRALQMTTIEPAMVGQMLGLALLGLAWLALRGAVDGAMTVGVAKIVGHVTWLAGALVLAWTIGPHTLWLPALGIVPNLLIGGLLVVVGLGGARFASAVRRREIAKAAQAAGSGGKAKARSASASPVSTPEPPVQVEPVLRAPEPSAQATAPVPNVRTDRAAAVSSQPGVRADATDTGADAAAAASSARAGAASGSDDVRPAEPASAPRPPFHG